MEAADLTEELTCPMCEKIYTDPVSLQCGDTFCRPCIDHVLDIHAVFGVHDCPVCERRINERPLLPSSTEMLQKLQTYRAAQARTEEEEEEEKVYCLYCEESRVLAVKTCVQCETPLCDQHLEAHNKELTHILIPPTAIASLAYRKCSKHGNVLQYYCSQDAACICESCGLTGSHQGHQIIALSNAFDDEKNKLHDFLCKLKLREEKIDRRIESMAEVTREAREKTATLTGKINAIFKEIKKHLNHVQKTIKEVLYNELQNISKLTKSLHKQKKKLCSKMEDVEELCDITDPVSLLQQVGRSKDLLQDDPDGETETNGDPVSSMDDLLENIIAASFLSCVSRLSKEFYKLYGSNES
ncbi:E3 ubiquitin-protein ligase TRIM8-like [Dendropsophus ebraccatus]|uniref:E3 ubiquitin-protein ligase TRIM8-like n=1 Tax=Dendropsophus ebraccatus TaxID=150705 RepID=UPI003831DE38